MMAKKWTTKEEAEKRKELVDLYIKKNKTISEVGKILQIGQSTVFDRLIRLGIIPIRFKKLGFNNQRNDIVVPKKYSADLAEFVGVLLGDGHVTPTQVTVTLGKKDEYVDYVVELMEKIFGVEVKSIVLPRGHRVVYLGSTVVVRWFLSMGLVFNKVKNQVDIPNWIFREKKYMRACLRGLIDTDGSVYKLKFGTQISFTNFSKPLIISVRNMLCELGFTPSKINGKNIYLTKKSDLSKFFKEVGFKNRKHEKRFLEFFGRVA